MKPNLTIPPYAASKHNMPGYLKVLLVFAICLAALLGLQTADATASEYASRSSSSALKLPLLRKGSSGASSRIHNTLAFIDGANTPDRQCNHPSKPPHGRTGTPVATR